VSVCSHYFLAQSHTESENLRACMHALKEEKAAAVADLGALVASQDGDSNGEQRYGRAAEEELLSTRAELTQALEEVRRQIRTPRSDCILGGCMRIRGFQFMLILCHV